MLTFIGISARILHPRFLPRHDPGYNTPKKHEEYKAMKNVNANTGPQRFAHRGLVQAAPENTLGAFQGAVDGGYEGIEIDVQMTRDGEIVIAQDVYKRQGGAFTLIIARFPMVSNKICVWRFPQKAQDHTHEKPRKI